MPTLKLSEKAFGTVGITIDNGLDLTSISDELNEKLGTNVLYDSLDLTNITRSGISAKGNTKAVDPRPNYSTPVGDLTLGAFNIFGDGTSISDFARVKFTDKSMTVGAPEGLLVKFFLYNDETNDELVLRAEYDNDGEGNDPLVNGYTSIKGDRLPRFDFSGVTEGVDFEASVFVNKFLSLTGGTGADFLVGSQFGNSLYGHDGNDVLFGGDNNWNQLDGGSGDDVIYGGGAVNYIYGDGGHDTIEGGDSGDNIYGGNGDDIIFCGDGDDTIDGGDGDDFVHGGDGNDVFSMSGSPSPRGDDYGDDEQYGGIGNDFLNLGWGKNTLEGNEGRDRFGMEINDPFNESPSPTVDINLQDTVTDFNPADDLLVIFVEFDSDLRDLSMLFLPDDNSEPTGDIPSELRVVSTTLFDGSYDYTIVDRSHGMTQNYQQHMLVRADPLDYYFVPWGKQDLSRVSYDGNIGEDSSFDTSYEIVYRDYFQDWSFDDMDEDGEFDEGEPQTLICDDHVIKDYDIFEGVSLSNSNGGITGGQDKFDLTDFGFYVPQIGWEALGDSVAFTVDAQTSEYVDTDFYDDELYGYLPVRVEYGAGGDCMVYVDADRNGGLNFADDPATTRECEGDLVFKLESPFGGATPDELTATDLYNDPNSDGTGTGIFIFNDSQYNLWYNDYFIA